MNVGGKGRNPFDFNNYSKMLLLVSNNIPRIKDKTGAVLQKADESLQLMQSLALMTLSSHRYQR